MTATTPRGMLERLAFGLYLVAWVASISLVGLGSIIGACEQDWRLVLAGAGGSLLVLGIRPFCYRHLHFSECEDSFEPSDARQFLVLDAAQAARADELEQTLAALDRAEDQRRAGAGDLWEVQRLRTHAAELLRSDRTLAGQFTVELERHPELGSPEEAPSSS